MQNDAIQELKNRLADNPLEDSDDLMEYVQYASRLAALGVEECFQEIPCIFNRPEFNEQIAEILKTRCEQGEWEAEEHTGEELALSLIDAQDFHCFEQRKATFPDLAPLFYDLEPWFTDWWDACEAADLDEDAASMLRDFLRVYPIPSEECLPVVETPITEAEYAFLDAVYRHHELPVFKASWQETADQLQSALTNTAGDMSFHDFAAEKPSRDLCDVMETQRFVEMPFGTVTIRRELTDDWELRFDIEKESGGSPPVFRVRIKDLPAYRNDDKPTCWFFDLKPLDQKERQRLLLVEPLHIRTLAGDIRVESPSTSPRRESKVSVRSSKSTLPAASDRELSDTLKKIVGSTSTIAKRQRFLFAVGTALSLCVVVMVSFSTLFQGAQRHSIADARIDWLAKDYIPLSTTARSAKGSTTEMTREEYVTRIAKTPDNVALLLEYSRFLLRKEQMDEAITVFERIQHLEPENPYAHLGLGIVEVMRKQDAAALSYFQMALDKAEAEPWAGLYANFNAAYCYKRLGNSDHQAEEHLKLALVFMEDSVIANDPTNHDLVRKLKKEIKNELYPE